MLKKRMIGRDNQPKKSKGKWMPNMVKDDKIY